MMKRFFLPLVAALLLAGGVQATNGNPNEGMVNSSEVMDITVGDLSVTFGVGNTLYTFHPERNNCQAYYTGDREVAYFEWGGNWSVDETAPHSEDYSFVYLKASGPLGSPSTVQVTVHFVGGGTISQLFGVNTNNDY